tara:strand:- start:400 stop:1146 length:747 start_codon:yes stop_codon:yes gene_type:complete
LISAQALSNYRGMDIKEIDRQNALTAAIIFFVLCGFLVLFATETPKPLYDVVKDFSGFLGACVGVAGAYFVAFQTMRHEDQKKTKSIATGLARKLHEKIFVMQRSMVIFDEKFRELNLGTIIAEKNYDRIDNFIEKQNYKYITNFYINAYTNLIHSKENDRFYFFANEAIALEYKIFSDTELLINYFRNMDTSKKNFSLDLDEDTIKSSCANIVKNFIYSIEISRKIYEQITQEYNLKEIGREIPPPV